MSVSKRDDLHHTYGDYLIWSRTHGDELIDGTAYVREPPSPSYSHQAIALELARQLQNQLDGTPWRVIIAPMDVRLPKSSEPDDQNARYGPPTIQKISGTTRLTVAPEVSVDWDRVYARALNAD